MLYTGPAYQPLNEFLRQLSVLRGPYRTDVARSPTRSFSATIGHLCRAIRKLAAVATPEEATMPLYRGVRGELPASTWVPDSSGLYCVVDTAFMSTSTARSAPIHYMGDSNNVLWELRPRLESDVAYHYGASVESLSQFAAEKEILFPPCTMMMMHLQNQDAVHGWARLRQHVHKMVFGKHAFGVSAYEERDVDDGGREATSMRRRMDIATSAGGISKPSSGGFHDVVPPWLDTMEETVNGKTFLSIRVTPHFV